MKVYVVLEGYWLEEEILAICFTKERAEQMAEEHRQALANRPGDYSDYSVYVEEHQVIEG